MGVSEFDLEILKGNVRGLAAEKPKARAVYRHKRGEMTGTEKRYEAVYLTPRVILGELETCRYESVTLRLAKNTRYTPDFAAMRPDGTREYHEVKGSGPVREASRVRFKIAAAMYPDAVFIWARERRKKDGGGFSVEVYQR